MNLKNFLIALNVCLLIMVGNMLNNIIENAAKASAFEDCRAKGMSVKDCKGS